MQTFETNNPEFEDMKKQAIGRQPFYYEGNLIYEWEQSIEDVIIYIVTPPVLLEENKELVKQNLKQGEKFPKLVVNFESTKLTVGLFGNPPYLSEELSAKIKISEAQWNIDGKEITITLPKAIKAETWKSAFKNHGSLNEIQLEEVRKKILKERFQEEHKGFDFSDANITGNVPDPKNFLGGLNYG